VKKTAQTRSRWAGLWLLAVLAGPACAALPEGVEPLERFPRAAVEVASGQARHRFEAWIADTPSRRVQGLMYVRELDPGRGMLFLSSRPDYANFWMANTYVSLDLLFIAPDGRIVNIIERAEPLSTNPLLSTAPVAGVLELLGGTAERLGIRPGDRVLHPAFHSSR